MSNNSLKHVPADKKKAIMDKFSRNKKISLFGFLSLTITMVITIYEYPSFASAGWALVLWLILGGFCWFIPVALCSAEMATTAGWQKGGIFRWVKNTLGPRYGFAAIFFQWFQITIGFFPMLDFMSSDLIYVFGGGSSLNYYTGAGIPLANNFGTSAVPYHGSTTSIPLIAIGAVAGIMILLFLAIACTQIFGVKDTVKIAKIGFIGGITIPLIFIVIFGAVFLSKNPDIVSSSMGHGMFRPQTAAGADSVAKVLASISQIVVFVSFILAYMGVEASASNANRLINAKKNYPKVMFILVIVAISFSLLGGIFVGLTTSGEVNLQGGILVSLQNMMDGSPQLVGPTGAAIAGSVATTGFTSFVAAAAVARTIGFLMAAGIFAEVAAWIVGPTFGVATLAQENYLPSSFAKMNKYGIPMRIVLSQMGLVIFWILVIQLGMGGGGIAFFASMSLTVIVYLSGYILLFTGYIKMKWKNKKDSKGNELKSKYIVFGGKTGGLFFGIMGLLTSSFAWIVTFFPAAQSLNNGGAMSMSHLMGFGAADSGYSLYLVIIICCYLGIISIPAIVYSLFKKYYKNFGVLTPEMKAEIDGELKEFQENDGNEVVHSKSSFHKRVKKE